MGLPSLRVPAIVDIGRVGTLSLVNDGLVIRDLDTEDWRFVRIEFSGSGPKIYEGIEETMKLYFDKVYGSLPGNKREQVIESLDTLLNALGEHECCK